MNDVIRIDEPHDDAGKDLSRAGALMPLPTQNQLGVRVRDARADDLPFIDALQKKHSKAVGWMPTGQLEGHINKGHVVIAEAMEGVGNRQSGIGQGNDQCPSLNEQWQAKKVESKDSGDARTTGGTPIPPEVKTPKPNPQHPTPAAARLGYCIGVDRYFKREDAGIIYQMNIEPGSQRGLLGATLLQAMFDRWPYGVRLCCCWCAQDLQANHFWEAMGFVPLAFRSGSKKRDRVHIFWQKQIRKSGQGLGGRGQGTSGGGGISGGGGWWFPSQTGGGAIHEDRIVLPIPPGTHWSDAKPRLFPEVSGLIASAAAERKALEAPAKATKRQQKREEEAAAKARAEEAKARQATVAAGGLRFGSPPPPEVSPQASPGRSTGEPAKAKDQATEKLKKPAPKNDPRLVSAARELRDRWLEHAAAHPGLIEQGNTAVRRYDVGRCVDESPSSIGPSPLTEMLSPEVPPKHKRLGSDAA